MSGSILAGLCSLVATYSERGEKTVPNWTEVETDPNTGKIWSDAPFTMRRYRCERCQAVMCGYDCADHDEDHRATILWERTLSSRARSGEDPIAEETWAELLDLKKRASADV